MKREIVYEKNYLCHHGVKGMKWGVRHDRVSDYYQAQSDWEKILKRRNQSVSDYWRLREAGVSDMEARKQAGNMQLHKESEEVRRRLEKTAKKVRRDQIDNADALEKEYGVQFKEGRRRTVDVKLGPDTIRMRDVLSDNERTYDKAKRYKSKAKYHNNFNRPGTNSFKRGYHAAKAVKYNRKADNLLKKLGKTNIQHVEAYKRAKASGKDYDRAKAALDDYLSRNGDDLAKKYASEYHR